MIVFGVATLSGQNDHTRSPKRKFRSGQCSRQGRSKLIMERDHDKVAEVRACHVSDSLLYRS